MLPVPTMYTSSMLAAVFVGNCHAISRSLHEVITYVYSYTEDTSVLSSASVQGKIFTDQSMKVTHVMSYNPEPIIYDLHKVLSCNA